MALLWNSHPAWLAQRWSSSWDPWSTASTRAGRLCSRAWSDAGPCTSQASSSRSWRTSATLVRLSLDNKSFEDPEWRYEGLAQRCNSWSFTNLPYLWSLRFVSSTMIEWNDVIIDRSFLMKSFHLIKRPNKNYDRENSYYWSYTNHIYYLFRSRIFITKQKLSTHLSWWCWLSICLN